MPYCSHCSYQHLPSEDAVRRHVRQSNNHPACPVCYRKFDDMPGYDEHVRRAHPQCSFCNHCSLYFASEMALENHFRDSRAHPRCAECKVGFLGVPEFKDHVAILHTYQAQCELCRRKFKDALTLQQHYVQSPNHPVCVTCTIGFYDDQGYAQHTKTFHPDLYCDQCVCVFSDKDSFHDHQLKSPVHEAYRCRHCTSPKIFFGVAEYDSHISGVHPEIFCKECKRIFRDKAEIQEHYIHSPDHIAYRCARCKSLEIFQSAEEYESHLRSHWREECTTCKIPFQSEKDLERHFLNSNAHPKCRFGCLIGLADNASNEKHLDLHHEKCGVCGGYFEGSVALFEHSMEAHRNLMCATCKSVYNDESTMKEHVAYSHPNISEFPIKGLPMPQEQPPEPLSPHTFDDVEDSPPAYNRNTLVSPLSNEGNLGSSIPSPDANRKNMGTNSLNQFTHNETTNSNPSLAQTSQEIHVESEDNDNSATAHGAENLTSDGNGYTPAETSHGDPNLDENLATNAVDTVNQGKSNDMDSPSASLGSSVDYEDDTDGGSDNLDEGDEATYDVTKAWSSGITTGHRPRLTLDTGDIWTSGLWASNVNTVVTARASQVASHWPSQNLPDAENTLGGGETTDGDTDSTTNLASLAQNDAVNPGTTTETDNRGHGPKSSGESDPSHLNSLPQTGGVSNSGSTSDVQQEQDNPAGGEFAEENNASEMVGNGRSAARSGGMPDGGTEETPKNSEGQTDPIITTLTSDPNGDRSAEEKNDEFSGSPYEGQEAESLQTGVLERSMPSAGESDSEESLTPFDPLGRSTVVSRSSNDPFGTDTFENAQLNMPTNTCGDGSPVVSASQSHQSDLDASDIGHEVEEITANADFGDATTHSGMANVGAEVDDDSDDNSEGNNDLTEDSSFSYDESSSINENRSGHQSSWARMLPRFTVPGGFIGDDL